jgi:hypothetical protein
MTAPDTRGWALIGLFALTGVIIAAVTFKPELQGNTLFVSIATLIVGSGGLLNAIGYFFGSSQGSTSKDSTIQSLVSQTPPAPTLSVQTTQPLPQQPTPEIKT